MDFELATDLKQKYNEAQFPSFTCSFYCLILRVCVCVSVCVQFDVFAALLFALNSAFTIIPEFIVCVMSK